MTERTSKSSGLRYGMTGFLHARQAAGAHPSARLALKEAGHIREDEAPRSDTVAAEAPASDASAANAAPPATARDPTPAPASSSTPARRTSRPTTKSKKRPRSHHFRFPEEIDGYLLTLATTFECTRTHVVCSAIQNEWTKLRRRQTREAKKQAAAQ